MFLNYVTCNNFYQTSPPQLAEWVFRIHDCVHRLIVQCYNACTTRINPLSSSYVTFFLLKFFVLLALEQNRVQIYSATTWIAEQRTDTPGSMCSGFIFDSRLVNFLITVLHASRIKRSPSSFPWLSDFYSRKVNYASWFL